jgi:hypothetical protein
VGVSGVSSKGNVYESSIQMFVFIKNSIRRCTTLTTGHTFLALSQEFRTSLKKYADSLRAKSVGPTRSGVGELTLAYLVNTAEYCGDTVPRLESMVKAKIKEELVELVDFSPEVDIFLDLVVDLIRTLANCVAERLEPSFKLMNSFNWSGLTQVSEESTYLMQMQICLNEVMSKIQPILSEVFYKNLCSKVAHDILYR